MELREFIKETLTQIALGVKDAQDAYKEYGGAVNPKGMTHIANATCGSYSKRPNEESIPLSDVIFEVALANDNNETSKGGIGVFLSAITLGVGGENGSSTSSINKVKFNILVQLPQQK